MKKEFAIITVLIASLAAFFAGRWSSHVGPQPATQAAPATVAGATGGEGQAPVGAGWAPATSPTKGNPNALVTIVEISDFQCPFCSRVGPTMKKIAEDYPNDVRIVWANEPLPFHDRAKPAAIAAMAAHRQGKFWEMHDKLFANQQQLTDENLEKFAKEIGLDVAKWKKDMLDPAIAQQIEKENAAASAVGASGTPSFFINGKLVQGAQPYESFKKEIDDSLAAAKKLAAGGKVGQALAEAAFAERDAQNGAKVATYFLKGELPAADAAAAPEAPKRGDAPAADKDEGPATAPPESQEVWKVPVDVKHDAIKGDSAKAQVTVVEFSDFQCPFCSRGAGTVTEVEKAYGDKVRIVFKHNPLPFHPNAKPASQAAIAAGKQGKFWEFYDKAFANQQNLTEENFVAWAKELGLNVDKFNTDRKDAAVAKQIEDDLALGTTVGIRGTPAFVINGRKIVGAQPIGVFKAVIDEELKKAGDKKGQGYYEECVAKGKVFTELGDTVADLKLDGLPFRGPKDAVVTITEFSDFQCPFCSRIVEPVHTAWEKRKDKVKVVFAHFPLSFHQFARPAATAAQEAWEESPEKFWKLHDLLFANQRELSEEKIDALAKEAGVDMDKLAKAKADKKYDKLFDATMEMGTKAGVEGTPTILINGRKYEPTGGYTPEAIGATLDKLIAAKK
jgi:protein-disulfide isomerase